MCGRFAFHSPHDAVAGWFGVEGAWPELPPRWNIAPTANVAVLRADSAGRRTLCAMHWGLMPAWAAPDVAARMINARAETIADKPAFRAPYRHRRGVVLADAYYEWRKDADGKRPYAVRAADGIALALAALWEPRVERATGEMLLSCTIVTRESAGIVRDLHPRMPVALAAATLGAWLDPERTDPVEIAPLLAAPPPDLVVDPVSRRVNSARNDGPELLRRDERPDMEAGCA